MKDEKGHGSNARGESSGVAQAADNFIAAHQGGVNEAVPSASGRALYEALSGRGTNESSGWDAKSLADMAPDFDELGDYRQYSVRTGKIINAQ